MNGSSVVVLNCSSAVGKKVGKVGAVGWVKCLAVWNCGGSWLEEAVDWKRAVGVEGRGKGEVGVEAGEAKKEEEEEDEEEEEEEESGEAEEARMEGISMCGERKRFELI